MVTRGLSGMMSMFHILIGMVATRYTFVKTHQTVLLKSVHSTACKLYFSKIDKRNKKETRKEGTLGPSLALDNMVESLN